MWNLGSGEEVRDREEGSHLHAGVNHLLPNVLDQLDSADFDPSEIRVKRVIDMGRVIGVSSLVSTGPDDEIVFAQRPNRDGLTRFVKNREPRPCSFLTVVLRKEDSGYFTLLTAFIGDRSENEPWYPDASAEAKKFWEENALVWGHEPVIEGTETSVSPY